MGDRGFPGHDETAPHGDPLRPKGQGRDESLGIADPPGGDDRNFQPCGHEGDQDHRGNKTRMPAPLGPLDDHRIRSIPFRPQGMFQRAHGGEAQNSVGFRPLDDPPGVAFSVTDGGNFFGDDHIQQLIHVADYRA